MKCSWCGKRRQTRPARYGWDRLSPDSAAPGIRFAGDVCTECYRWLEIDKASRAIRATHIRPGDVVHTGNRIGRVAEMHFGALTQRTTPGVIIDLDDGGRASVYLADCVLVESCSVPVLVWCGVALTVDHQAATTAPIVFEEAA